MFPPGPVSEAGGVLVDDVSASVLVALLKAFVVGLAAAVARAACERSNRWSGILLSGDPAGDPAVVVGLVPALTASALARASADRFNKCSGMSTIFVSCRPCLDRRVSVVCVGGFSGGVVCVAYFSVRCVDAYRGPDIPPSLRTRQKWIAINITITKGNSSTCKTYHRSSVSVPISTPPSSTKRT